MKSLGERLEECGGVGPGFDLLRLVLASLVVVYHSFRVDYGPLGSAGHFWFIGEMIVPMFFVLITRITDRVSRRGKKTITLPPPPPEGEED